MTPRPEPVAGDIMTEPAIACREGAFFEEVAELLADRDISGVPVADASATVVGVISECDLAYATEVETWALHCHILTHAESENGMFGNGHRTREPYNNGNAGGRPSCCRSVRRSPSGVPSRRVSWFSVREGRSLWWRAREKAAACRKVRAGQGPAGCVLASP
jgi:CBS domain